MFKRREKTWILTQDHNNAIPVSGETFDRQIASAVQRSLQFYIPKPVEDLLADLKPDWTVQTTAYILSYRIYRSSFVSTQTVCRRGIEWAVSKELYLLSFMAETWE